MLSKLLKKKDKEKEKPNQNHNRNQNQNQKHKQKPGRKQHQPLRIIPLGGIGEVGKNMTVFEYQSDLLLVDCGIKFPDDELLGVDLILPDYNYIKAKQDRLKAIVITHGHEDHIGGLPYVLKEIRPVPIYASRFTIELIKNKLADHSIRYDQSLLRIVQPRAMVKVGAHFKVEFLSVNHSIPDCFALAIHTALGTVVHTGDFKVDYNPIDHNQFDFFKFAELGEKGVLMLMADSTNVERKYIEHNEKDVGRALSRLIASAPGRVIVASFASNISRISQIVQIAVEQDRKIAVFGRNMESNFEIARRFGYIKVQDQFVLNSKDVKNYPENKQVIVTTGSQGEPMSALSLISKGIHKYIKIKPGDTVIISSSVISGNEKSVSKIINTLFLQGANVFYDGVETVHVSGHATREHLKLMMRMTKPKFLMPVHGEERHLVHHAEMAEHMGWERNQIILSQNGDVVQLLPDEVKIVDHIVQDHMFVDGNMVGDVNKLIKERKTMSEDGVIIAIAGVRVNGEQIECIPDVVSKGFFFGEEMKNITEDLKKIIDSMIIEQVNRNGFDYNALNNAVKKGVERYVQQNFHKNPMIITRIVEIDS